MRVGHLESLGLGWTLSEVGTRVGALLFRSSSPHNLGMPPWSIYREHYTTLHNPLIITHWCSNNSISIIKSINLVNARDLSHFSAWALFLSILKLRYFFRVEGFSDQTYELCYCLDISVIQILTKPWQFMQWHYDFWGGVQMTGNHH